MATSYAGMCVGGPMAGKAVACQSMTMKVGVRGTGTFTYNWHHAGAIGFWIPEGQTIHDAILEMARVYQEMCDGRGRTA